MATNFYPATGLADSLTGDLNTIDGTDLVEGDGALIITSLGYIYRLDATSGLTQDVPSIITPLTNAGTKRWILIHTFNPLRGALSKLVYSNIPGAF